MNRIIISFLFLSLSMYISAEPKPVPAIQDNLSNQTVSNPLEKSIVGKIMDIKTSETLAGACITYNGQKIYSDLEGNFQIKNLLEGNNEISISLISYEDQIVEIESNAASTLKIKLKQR